MRQGAPGHGRVKGQISSQEITQINHQHEDKARATASVSLKQSFYAIKVI